MGKKVDTGKRGRADNKYIHNLARNIAGQLGLRWDDFDISSPQLACAIWKTHGTGVITFAACWSSETLGRICACGLGETTDGQCPLAQVHFSSNWLHGINGNSAGKTLLVYIAATAIVAAIADNMRYGDLFERRGSLPAPRFADAEEPVTRGRKKSSRPTLEDYDRR
jgi:hypothetical protein